MDQAALGRGCCIRDRRGEQRVRDPDIVARQEFEDPSSTSGLEVVSKRRPGSAGDPEDDTDRRPAAKGDGKQNLAGRRRQPVQPSPKKVAQRRRNRPFGLGQPGRGTGPPGACLPIAGQLESVERIPAGLLVDMNENRSRQREIEPRPEEMMQRANRQRP